jgi:hypothetical protein
MFPPRLTTVLRTGQLRQSCGHRRPSLPSGPFQLFKCSHVKPPSITVPPKLAKFDLVVQPACKHSRRTRNTVSTPFATLVTDASMEGWGAVMHSHGKREVSPQLTPTATTIPNLLQNLGTSVPARGLFIPTDAEPVSINQRELLAAIMGQRNFLPISSSLHVNFI